MSISSNEGTSKPVAFGIAENGKAQHMHHNARMHCSGCAGCRQGERCAVEVEGAESLRGLHLFALRDHASLRVEEPHADANIWGGLICPESSEVRNSNTTSAQTQNP